MHFIDMNLLLYAYFERLFAHFGERNLTLIPA